MSKHFGALPFGRYCRYLYGIQWLLLLSYAGELRADWLLTPSRVVRVDFGPDGPTFAPDGPLLVSNPAGPTESVVIAVFPIVLPGDGVGGGSDLFGPAQFVTRPIGIEFDVTVHTPGRLEIYGTELLSPLSDREIFDTFSPPEDKTLDPRLEVLHELFLADSRLEFRDTRVKKLSKMDFIEQQVLNRSFALFLREGRDGSESFTITSGSLTASVGPPVPEPTSVAIWLVSLAFIAGPSSRAWGNRSFLGFTGHPSRSRSSLPRPCGWPFGRWLRVGPPRHRHSGRPEVHLREERAT